MNVQGKKVPSPTMVDINELQPGDCFTFEPDGEAYMMLRVDASESVYPFETFHLSLTAPRRLAARLTDGNLQLCRLAHLVYRVNANVNVNSYFGTPKGTPPGPLVDPSDSAPPSTLKFRRWFGDEMVKISGMRFAP